MKAHHKFFAVVLVGLIAAVGVIAQTEGGGRVAGSGGADSTFKPKVRAVAKHTVPKRTTRAGKTAAQYEAEANKFYDDKDYDSALVAYQSAVNIRPSANSLYRIGWIQNDFGEFDKALVALERATAIDPAYASAFLEKGYALRRLKRVSEAAVALKKCIQLNPQSSIGHYELGVLYFDQGQFENSVSMLQKATSIRPDYQDAYEELGIALRRAGRNDEAIDALNRAIELDPEAGNAYMGLGDVYYYGTKDYSKAIDAYIKGLEYDKDNHVAAFNIGWSYNDLGNFDDAITYLDEATRLKPDYLSALNELGYANMKLKRYPAATAALRRSIEIDQKNGIAHYYLGQVHLATNNRGAALAEYRQLQTLGSDYAPKLYKMINP